MLACCPKDLTFSTRSILLKTASPDFHDGTTNPANPNPNSLHDLLPRIFVPTPAFESEVSTNEDPA